MLRTITGLFDTRADADAVVEHLMKHDGLDSSRVRVHGGEATTAKAGDDKGFWSSLKDLFVPDEDRLHARERTRERADVLVDGASGATRSRDEAARPPREPRRAP